MLLATLSNKTSNKIYVVGNLAAEQRKLLSDWPILYLDENEVDLSDRVPRVSWTQKYREWGWYKQMFLRLCADRFVEAEQVVVLDSEVFVFDNWDERRFYTPSGDPKCFYWISKARKPDWDYRMYRGAAFLYQGLSSFENVMDYANSDGFRRHISGVVQFSTKNLKHIWKTLSEHTDLAGNLDRLFNREPELAFCDHDFYGISIDYNLCKHSVPTAISNELLGWYDNHNDANFNIFRNQDPMWSMCQRYYDFPDEAAYLGYMQRTSASLNRPLPDFRRGVTKSSSPNGDSAHHAKDAQYEKRLSDLEARVLELQGVGPGSQNANWQSIAPTVDAILRQLTERFLRVETSHLQLKDFVLKQSPADARAQRVKVEGALVAAHAQLAALDGRLCDYEIALRNIKNLGGQLGIALHEQNQLKSGAGPRFVPLKAKGCTEEDMNSDWVAFWAGELRDAPRYQRKLWELCYVSQILYNEGMLQEGKRGLGFACGSEPLPSLFAKYGVRVLATDLAPDRAEAKAWINSGQHVVGFEKLRRPNICPDESRLATIEGAYVDMNAIPPELDEQFDFCWSVCSLEHLGSIANGLKFVANSLRTLKPGGVSVHTAEFNVNEGRTIQTGPTVLFQKHHFVQLAERLRAYGFHVYDFDFDSGRGILDGLVDLPPYDQSSSRSNRYAHLKLSISGFVCTSFSFIVKKPE